MGNSSYFREKAAQAMRLAHDSTDPALIKNLSELAAEYTARAIAIDAALGEDPEKD